MAVAAVAPDVNGIDALLVRHISVNVDANARGINRPIPSDMLHHARDGLVPCCKLGLHACKRTPSSLVPGGSDAVAFMHGTHRLTTGAMEWGLRGVGQRIRA
jgi:hypothetical protein